MFALRDVCSHEEVPLSEGEIYDHTVECWLHGSCFDLRTGNPTGPPATEPVPTYPVKIEGDDVYVALADKHGADNNEAGDRSAEPIQETQLMATLEIRDLHVSVTDGAGEAGRSCAAST